MGVRAEIQINSPSDCPVVSVSTETGAKCNSIRKTSTSESADAVTEEFLLDTDDPPASLDEATDVDVEEVFSYGSKHTYRFRRPQGDCVCERIEIVGCPITDVHSRNGDLFITFHTTGIDELKGVLSELRERWSDVMVTRLLYSAKDEEQDDLVLLDRSELTDRQREVLETAYDMGYFHHGSGANAGEVAAALDINTSTFSEHLKAAQGKLLNRILDG